MLIKSKYFYGMSAQTLDGLAGKVVGLLCDSSTWVVRYVVVQNRSLFERKRLLISTEHISQIDYEEKAMKVNLTLSALEDGPVLEDSNFVGVEIGKNFFDLKGWPYYDKMYQSGWVNGPFNIVWQDKGLTHDKQHTGLHLETDKLINPLRLLGMSIQSKDRDFGVIKNLMIDPESWKCKFIEIRKVKWLPSDFTVIPVEIISEIDWDRRHAVVDAFEYQILEAPYYNPRIFSTLSEKLFLHYYKIETRSLETEFDELHINKSIA